MNDPRLKSHFRIQRHQISSTAGRSTSERDAIISGKILQVVSRNDCVLCPIKRWQRPTTCKKFSIIRSRGIWFTFNPPLFPLVSLSSSRSNGTTSGDRYSCISVKVRAGLFEFHSHIYGKSFFSVKCFLVIKFLYCIVRVHVETRCPHIFLSLCP